MAARGYEGTSLQAVADAVGIRKPSILYHFPNKEALRAGVLEQLLQRWNEVLPRLMMAAGHDGAARFEAVMAEMLRFFAAEPDRARLLLRELLDRPEAMSRYLTGYVAPWMDVVARYVRRGQREGSVRADLDPKAWILQLITASLTAFAAADRAPDLLGERGRERYLDELIRMARVSLFNDHGGQP